ncbi:hypothetical protein QE152_g14166 [Popillia japonica]|uniref:Uncharacterized protein n=1 Tax=Popillia japonica TaxID=7064 RepID=A0AAW1LA76_POPJA
MTNPARTKETITTNRNKTYRQGKDLNQGTTKEKTKKVDDSNKNWKLATWNVKGITGKEKELEEEFVNMKVDILAITETKKKGQGIMRGRVCKYESGHTSNNRNKKKGSRNNEDR